MASAVTAQFDYLARIWELRYFWSNLVRNDIVARYRRSFLGIGWSLVRPLSMTLVYCVVFGTIFNQPMETYAPFLMVGQAVWQYIQESLIGGSNSFVNGEAYIRQQKVPLAIFPLRQVLSSGFHFLIAFAVAIAVTIFFGGLVNPWMLFGVLPGMVLLFFFCWFSGIVVGLIQTHFPDTSHLLEITLQILFYLTPIVIMPQMFEGRHRLKMLIQCNPLYSLMEIIRRPILSGEMAPLQNWAIMIGFVIFVGLLARFLLRRLERNLVFWI